MQTDREPTIRLTLTPSQTCTLLEALAAAMAVDCDPEVSDLWALAVDALGDLCADLPEAHR
jgi:hypothetical protein